MGYQIAQPVAVKPVAARILCVPVQAEERPISANVLEVVADSQLARQLTSRCLRNHALSIAEMLRQTLLAPYRLSRCPVHDLARSHLAHLLRCRSSMAWVFVQGTCASGIRDLHLALLSLILR